MTTSKIITGLEQAAAHAKDDQAREAGEIFARLALELVGNESFSEGTIIKHGDKLKIILRFESGVISTIYENHGNLEFPEIKP